MLDEFEVNLYHCEHKWFGDEEFFKKNNIKYSSLVQEAKDIVITYLSINF